MKLLNVNPGTVITKKLSLVLSMLLLCTFQLFSQVEDEKKLNIRTIEPPMHAISPAGRVDCKCEKNILADGGFENLTASGSNITSASTPWKPNTYTPQWTPVAGPCNKGYVQMWGNQAVGESIIQTGVTILPGHKYSIKFTAKVFSPTATNPFVRLKAFAFTGAVAPHDITGPNVIGVSPNITNTGWATYTMPDWTAPLTPTLTGVQLHPENASAVNDGNYVSWIQIDAICITEVPDPCACIKYPEKPAITGTTVACACDPIKFATVKCPGASYSWSVKDNKGNNISLSGVNTNAITLNYSLAQQVASDATSFTVTVTIKCGDRFVTNTIVVPLKPIPKTNISFSLNDNGSGSYTATASAIGPIALSDGNGWTLKEVTCPGPNPCSWVAGPIKWQASGTSISIPNGVLVKGKCYILNHYVNVCSSTWISTPCTVYKTTCFKLDGNQMRMMQARETDANDAMEITSEMISDLRVIKQ